MGIGTPIWPIEGVALDSTGDSVANSLGARVATLNTAVATIDAEVLTIDAETDKIDDAATDGMSGMADSLAYFADVLRNHHHSYERWFELAGTPSGTHKADRIGTVGGGGVFIIDAANDDWGAWVQLLGVDDTPDDGVAAHYDFHRLEVAAAERNEIYFVQIGFGASGAAALSAGSYTELVLKPLSNQIDSGPIYLQAERQAAGTLAWARCLCPGQNTATLSFFFGLHEYEG